MVRKIACGKCGAPLDVDYKRMREQQPAYICQCPACGEDLDGVGQERPGDQLITVTRSDFPTVLESPFRLSK
jgi:ribosomal protein L34E